MQPLPHLAVVHLSSEAGEARATARSISAEEVVLESSVYLRRGSRCLVTFGAPGAELGCQCVVARWLAHRRSVFIPRLGRWVVAPGRFVARVQRWESGAPMASPH